ncbi:hypothetical protein HHK36_020174 [Tetracentron sinense]|uniref:Uncharacterized protein n=1 Tax=Tetracentron sinense TaxID=13715 RepID=A0A834YT59_TETSI|nr:hypothetical protein HHK36_020174 [Tetracentron sinense]
MAESAVTFLIERLATFTEQELKLLTGVRKELESITKELEMIRGYLKDADAKGESGGAVKVWVDQVRDIAYDTEDILDEFTYLQQQYQRHGFVGFLYKTVNSVKHLKLRHNLATQIQDIKENAVQVFAKWENYHLNRFEQSSSSNSTCEMLLGLRQNALLLPNAELVGIDEPREKMIGWLVKGETRLEVISVWSMGGSESFKINELLKDLIKQLYGEINQSVPHGVETMDVASLKNLVNEFLQRKRYVVVLDDIWSIDAWEHLKYALPDSNCGSRIMVTTRSFDVASSCKEPYGHVYNLEPLTEEDSWTLFCKKVFRENSCPQQLEVLSRNILKICGGLPLAIVTIGGVLSTKEKTLIEWDMVHRSLGSLLESNDKLKNMQKILSLSYNDLPYHLKPCFLYLSIFPEDHLIQSWRIIMTWIAEGLVREREGLTLEEVAESYLYEFTARSLLQIVRTRHGGQVKGYKIHDLVHDILVKKSNELNFGVKVAEQKTNWNQEKVRRLSIHNIVGNIPENQSFTHLRSLFMFGVDTVPKSSMRALFSSFRLLRVLDLSDAPFEKLPNEIVNLFHLRYLSLRRTKIRELPNSIGKLQNLETLDLKGNFVCKLPSEIFKLKRLRFLMFYNISPVSINESHKQVVIWSLVDLQVLRDINVSQGEGVTRELGRLTKLKMLGLRGQRREDGVDLCSSIEKMRNLRFLDVLSEGDTVLDIQYLSDPPIFLQKLYLKGRLEKFPDWINPSLENLESIRLVGCSLGDDPLEFLQDLPNLVQLRLDNAYDGREMCVKERGFQKLEILQVFRLKGLRFVSVEKGGLSRLENLSLGHCKMLEKVPLGIEYLTNLQVFIFSEMSDEFVTSLNSNEQGEDYWKVSHIPTIFSLKFSRDGSVTTTMLNTHSIQPSSNERIGLVACEEED